MPASYVHQSVAAHAADALPFSPPTRSTARCWRARRGLTRCSSASAPGKPFAPVVASLLHTQKTDDFLLALCDACAGDALLRAYCCGFFHALCDGYHIPSVRLRPFSDGGGQVFRQRALYAGTPARKPRITAAKATRPACRFRWAALPRWMPRSAKIAAALSPRSRACSGFRPLARPAGKMLFGRGRPVPLPPLRGRQALPHAGRRALPSSWMKRSTRT